MKEIKKNCLRCGDEYIPVNNAQKYCSDCGCGYHRKYEQVETVTCRECGKEFKTSCSNAVYCSKECARIWHNKAKAMRRKENKRYCVVCGTELTDYQHRRYCSEECKKNNKVKYYQPKKAKKEKVTSLDDIALKAREEGLTYGQYVVKYRL